MKYKLSLIGDLRRGRTEAPVLWSGRGPSLRFGVVPDVEYALWAVVNGEVLFRAIHAKKGTSLLDLGLVELGKLK